METEQENLETIIHGIKIKAALEERIANHIRALKHLKGEYSKKKWIQEAIKERLQSYQKINLEKIKSDRSLNINMSRDTHNEIFKIVKILKKLGVRASKTEFLIEAILDKLEREEENVRKLFQNMLKKASKASK